jgi:hypothetical protein
LSNSVVFCQSVMSAFGHKFLVQHFAFLPGPRRAVLFRAPTINSRAQKFLTTFGECTPLLVVIADRTIEPSSKNAPTAIAWLL